MEIRQATKKDIPRLLELYREGSRNEARLFDSTITPGWTDRPGARKKILKRFDDPKAIEFVPIVEGVIAGYLIGFELPPIHYRIPQKSGELLAFYVEPKYRGKGIGSALIKKFLLWCKKRNIEAIRLTVSAKNSKAIALYERHGFHVLDTVMEINPKNKFFKTTKSKKAQVKKQKKKTK